MKRLAVLVTSLILAGPVAADHLQTQDGHSLSFEHKGGNEWWVEVVVDGPGTFDLNGVEAQDTDGRWVALEEKSWGAWAASFHIEPGHDVRFRALFDDGEVVSCWFSHPEGIEDCSRTSETPATYAGGFEAHAVDLNGDIVALAGQGPDAKASAFDRRLSEQIWTVEMGGPDFETARAVAVADEGNVYMAGYTEGDFPTTAGAYDRTRSDYEGFVVKIAPDGEVAWSTYLGGSSYDRINAVAIDYDGNLVVAGNTQSCDFPTTPGAHGSPFGTCADAFVTRLSSDGSKILHSTVYGGSNHERGLDMQLTPDGAPVLLGYTGSEDIPTTEGAYDRTINADRSLFVARLSPDLSSVERATYLGSEDGTVWVEAGFAVDAQGAVYVVGETTSDRWPTTAGAFQEDLQSPTGCQSGPTSFDAPCPDGFLSKFTPDLSALAYSSYVGGSDEDGLLDVAVDDEGQAHVVGYTASTDLVAPANGETMGFRDALHGAMSADGSSLVPEAYGGSQWDEANGATAQGLAVYLAGFTRSEDFATSTDAHDRSLNGHGDMFVAQASGGSGETDTDVVFDSRNGNEWWVQVHVSGADPSRVQAQDTGDPWKELELKDWGHWASSFHVEPGNDVRHRAMVDGDWVVSCWFTHPDGKAPDGSDSCSAGGSQEPPPSGDFDASFDTPGGNEWWVEVYVEADEPIAGVEARDDGGKWIALEKKDWGAWAKSFHVEDGSIVEFRATSSDGARDISDGYRWPSGGAV